MAQLEAAVGERDEAQKLQAEASAIQQAFHAHLFHANNNSYGTGRDDELVYALALGMVPEANTKAIVETLRAQVTARGYFIVDAFGVWLLRDMIELGLASEVGQWLASTTRPSYGYFLNNPIINATTMMEHWNTPEENTSHNHAWLNSVSLLFRSHVLGISPTLGPAGGGWRNVTVRPWPAVLNATWQGGNVEKGASGGLDTANGPIAVDYTVFSANARYVTESRAEGSNRACRREHWP